MSSVIRLSLMMHSYSAAAIAIVRTTKLPADLHTSSDVVSQYVTFFIWNILEVNSLIISSCIPTLMPLWKLVRRRAGSWYKTRRSTSRKTLDGRYALDVVFCRKGRRHQSLDGQTIPSQAYVNLDAESNRTDFVEGSDSRYTASVSAPGHINEVEQGIHMSTEVNVSLSRPKILIH